MATPMQALTDRQILSRRRRLDHLIGGLLALMAMALAGCSAVKERPPALAPEAQIENLIATEEWISRQTNQMPKLGRSVKNLRLPDVGAEALFAVGADLRGLDLQGRPSPDYRVDALGVEAASWPVSSQSQAELWKPFLDQVAWFEHAKFAIVRAKFVDPGRAEILSDVHFSGLARDTEGKLLQVEADQEIRWRKAAQTWQIDSWHQKSLSTVRAKGPFFRDVVDQAIPEQLRGLVKGSAYEQMLRTVKGDPPKYFSAHSADRHPSVSIVDIDRDGFDDFYVTERLGTNLFFRNKGDGTFEEIAAQLGLDFKDDCSAAIFADFDNDGDSDLFLGRTLQPSLYLVNENGRFVDRTATHVSTDLPYLVFSISSADYNGDGLLDVFFSTYAQETQDASLPDDKSKTWLAEFLSPEDARQLYQRPRQDGMLDMPGPPNVLLVNAGGGKFALSPFNSQLAAWRQTSQGTWSDFDDDGDPDIYLANDFAPNMMFRNDGPSGFTDVTEPTGTADLGFGMGVSWGDYDLDGRQDLYVSNMFSKAGQRITALLDPIDPRVARMSGGNSLFRNRGERFEKVSGLKSPALQVEKAGWSYSSQFTDIDNDGYLDIYALSGFYSAPADIALPIDL
jgi:hypothetical protein